MPDDEREVDITLDLETLEAETEFGTLHAQRAANSFVGPLGEDQAVGVAFLDELGIGTQQEVPMEIAVYLYDGSCFELLLGEVDAEGKATLESDDVSDFEATVELVMDDDAVTGTVSLMGEAATPFTAEAATGVGSVYWAHGTDEEPDVSAEWVVLPDERQWGCVCCCSYTSRCCAVRL